MHIQLKDWPYTNLVDPEIYKHRTDWPKISIVTPSYNQGQFIEETILSILNQNYPNLEYIIIDGGSTDNTVEVIKKYEDRITYWVSEKDKGQAHAINKGLEKSKGDFFCFINSDDYYKPKALIELVTLFTSENIVLAYSNVDRVNEESKYLGKTWEISDVNFTSNLIFRGCPFPQPGVMFRTKALKGINGMDSTFHLSFDYKCFLEMSFIGGFAQTYSICANFRTHQNQKTFTGSIKETKEMLRILRPYLKDKRLSAIQKKYLMQGIAIQYQARFKIFRREKKYFQCFFYFVKFAALYLPNRI
jgi:glycosyltransferase involved in cell wall biosynthesis